MIRVFVTGDLHVGREYGSGDTHPRKKDLAENRLEVIQTLVDQANNEKCDMFVITGDLFDNRYIKKLTKKRIGRVVELLSAFQGYVLWLPGNHDFYSTDANDNELWEVVQQNIDKQGSDIRILNRFEPEEIDLDEGTVIVYPAYCHTDRVEENNLGWIKDLNLQKDDVFKIGVAHGAIEGVAIDTEGVHFFMRKDELEAIPVDAWLIGHAHVMYPRDLTEDYKVSGRIYNAGAHVQMDVGNNTDGNCIILEMEKQPDGEAVIRAKRFVSGNLFFKRLEVRVEQNGSGTELRDSINAAIKGIERERTSISLEISGVATMDEYDKRDQIYEECLTGFYEQSKIDDKELRELISEELIDREFTDQSFPSRLLKELIQDPKKTQLVYELLTSDDCKA